MRQIPNTIFLQVHGDGGPSESRGETFDEQGVTWSVNRVFPSDVEYVRAPKQKPEVSPLPDSSKIWLSADDACRYLGVSRTTLYRLEREGRITASRSMPRRPRFSRPALDAFLGGKK